MTKLPNIKPVKTVTKIQSKGATVKDPIRYPKITGRIEKDFTDSYLKMLNTMTKMIQIELVNKTKRK